MAKDKQKYIIGIRVFDNRGVDKDGKRIPPSRTPYIEVVAAIFDYFFAKFRIPSPGYKEIYFNCGGDKEYLSGADWAKSVYLDIEAYEYENLDREGKIKLLINLIIQELRKAVDEDGLNSEMIENLIQNVQESKADTVFISLSKDYKKYYVEIIYYPLLIDEEMKIPYFLRLKCKESGQVGEISLGLFDVSGSYQLGSIVIKDNKVIIKAKKGARADWFREKFGLPDAFGYDISEIISAKQA